jgi:formylglycine-generating enzyme required for sulfatase activity
MINPGDRSKRDLARVVRGGSWNNNGRNVRSAIRNRNTPDNRNNNLGFRLALAQQAWIGLNDPIVILSCNHVSKKQDRRYVSNRGGRLPDGRHIAHLSSRPKYYLIQSFSSMNHRNPLSPPIFPYPWAVDWGEDRFGLWQAFNYQGIHHAFRWITPGNFMMGSPEAEQGRYEDEDLHRVTLSQGFWLAETTVTQALWQAVMAENPSYFKAENRPVESVSWKDAQVFIKQLNQHHPDLTTRLPWEAEWEYACRADSQTPFHFGDELALDLVNYRGIWGFGSDEWGEGAKQETAEVKSYPGNAWGLYEMHGNVWEWCEDVWQEKLGKDAVHDPWPLQQVPGSDLARVVRGGAWYDLGWSVCSAFRSGNVPDYRLNNLGFRLALCHSGSSQAGGAKGES